jgi:hypothetical protein
MSAIKIIVSDVLDGKDVEPFGLGVSCTVTVGSTALAPAVTAIEEEEEDHIVSAILWCGRL